MRIAFASCMFTRVFARQPVWDWIAAQQPDHLVLLGDALYLDVATDVHPQQMDDDAFARHQFTLYGELLAQRQFRALVRQMPPGSVHAVWDDHDFLWDNAQGAEMHPVHSGKVRVSTAFMRCFRRALSTGLAEGSFPTVYNDADLWDLAEPPLATPSVMLADDLWLHLADVRTHRTRTFLLAEARRTLLGEPQRRALQKAVRAAPWATHLLASGSTLAGWQRYTRDLAWLKSLAVSQRLLVLSGDIHRNELDAFYTGGLPLHEATSSGAAVRDAVVAGKACRNHGLLDIDREQVRIRLFKDNAVEHERVLDRAAWLPA